jgi:hypothetical protein
MEMQPPSPSILDTPTKKLKKQKVGSSMFRTRHSFDYFSSSIFQRANTPMGGLHHPRRHPVVCASLLQHPRLRMAWLHHPLQHTLQTTHRPLLDLRRQLKGNLNLKSSNKNPSLLSRQLLPHLHPLLQEDHQAPVSLPLSIKPMDD